MLYWVQNSCLQGLSIYLCQIEKYKCENDKHLHHTEKVKVN